MCCFLYPFWSSVEDFWFGSCNMFWFCYSAPHPSARNARAFRRRPMRVSGSILRGSFRGFLRCLRTAFCVYSLCLLEVGKDGYLELMSFWRTSSCRCFYGCVSFSIPNAPTYIYNQWMRFYVFWSTLEDMWLVSCNAFWALLFSTAPICQDRAGIP